MPLRVGRRIYRCVAQIASTVSVLFGHTSYIDSFNDAGLLRSVLLLMLSVVARLRGGTAPRQFGRHESQKNEECYAPYFIEIY